MLRKLVLFTYILVITGLSLLPAGSIPLLKSGLIPHFDKVVHFMMYAGFSFLLFFTWPEHFSGRARQFLPLLYIFTWGTLMEIFQALGGYGRHFSYLDIVANTLGFFPGWVAWTWISKMFYLNAPVNANHPKKD
jgi:VanZ family protein